MTTPAPQSTSLLSALASTVALPAPGPEPLRLTQLRVRHFQSVRAAEVSFSEGLNLLYGPDEDEAPVLAEALRAVLLVRPGPGRGESYRSELGAEAPEVVLEYVSGGDAYRLSKTLSDEQGGLLEVSRDGRGFVTVAEGAEVERHVRAQLAEAGRAIRPRVHRALDEARSALEQRRTSCSQVEAELRRARAALRSAEADYQEALRQAQVEDLRLELEAERSRLRERLEHAEALDALETELAKSLERERVREAETVRDAEDRARRTRGVRALEQALASASGDARVELEARIRLERAELAALERALGPRQAEEELERARLAELHHAIARERAILQDTAARAHAEARSALDLLSGETSGLSPDLTVGLRRPVLLDARRLSEAPISEAGMERALREAAENAQVIVWGRGRDADETPVAAEHA